ncbi:MAG: pyruvate kinase [Christensenellales bacterium]|jgi:pyruvate kinase
MRRTKIIATLGPSSNSELIMDDMLRSGMNVARINLSHGDHTEHRARIEAFRAARDRLGMPAAVLLDTRGPEIRLGAIEGGSVELFEGAQFIITSRTVVGDSTIASMNYPDLPKQMRPGQRILIDDGSVRLIVREISADDIKCEVEYGGRIGTSKGVNVPDAQLEMPYLSQKDKDDLVFGVEMDADYIAASFVRSAEDVRAVRQALDYHGGQKIRIIAKIENEEGVSNIDDIIREADGIMVARGDMGVEIPFERLPGIQKRFIHACYRAGKPAIVATQMLDSMIRSSTPTRAEITDVANAVFDGASAVMLSGETAMGAHPALVVRTMARIAMQAEADALGERVIPHEAQDIDTADITDAIAAAACTTAAQLDAKLIVADTKTGRAARRISKHRPTQIIVGATPLEKTFHQLSLIWGVYPVRALMQKSIDDLFLHAVACAKASKLANKGDIVVVTAGAPLNVDGNTNMLKAERI